MMRRRTRVRLRVFLGVIVAAAVLLGLAASTGASSNVWSKTEVEDAIASLDAWYEGASQAVALSGDPTDLTALNEEYEKRFAEIGGERPNGQPVLPESKDDNKSNAGVMGLTPVGESDSVYSYVNRWHGILDGRRELVAVAAVRRGDGVAGVLIIELAPTGPWTFIPAPAKGDISIVADEGDGTLLVQVGEAKLVFDLRAKAFVSPGG